MLATYLHAALDFLRNAAKNIVESDECSIEKRRYMKYNFLFALSTYYCRVSVWTFWLFLFFFLLLLLSLYIQYVCIYIYTYILACQQRDDRDDSWAKEAVGRRRTKQKNLAGSSQTTRLFSLKVNWQCCVLIETKEAKMKMLPRLGSGQGERANHVGVAVVTVFILAVYALEQQCTSTSPSIVH